MRRIKVNKNKSVFITAIIFMIAFSAVTIGFASYSELVNINGQLLVQKFDTVSSNAIFVDKKNVSSSLVEANYTNLSYDIVFTDDNNYVEYIVEFTNDTNDYYEFAEIVSDGEIEYEIEDFIPGDSIKNGETKTLRIRMKKTELNGEYEYKGQIKFVFVTENVGSLFATIVSDENIDLISENFAEVQIKVINTYKYSKIFSFNINNSNFLLTNSNGLTLEDNTILAGETKTYSVYIKAKDTSIFYDETEKLSISMISNGLSTINVGTLTAKVNKAIIEPNDKEAPKITGLSVNQSNTEGVVNLSWNSSDDSSIKNYTVMVYKDNALTNTLTTKSDEKNMMISDLSEGTYIFKVYGEDVLGNKPLEKEIIATTSSSGVQVSSSITLKWIYNVTNNMSNLTFTGNSTVKRGETYTASISPSGTRYSNPDSITVTMNSQTISDYTYNKSSGSITIPNVVGDINIKASASGCLIKGTKVLLYNDVLKNIEDITYNDLLKVWDYDTGTYTYEYPIWIEKEKSTTVYQRTTFDDGTVLNTYGYHGVFNLDTNMFISVDDEDFKIGTRIAKIVNGEIIPIVVKKIELVYEDTYYYHVVSTRYYNIIANNILTTDGTTILSNLYGFDDGIKWPSNKDAISSDQSNNYDYNDFKDIIPYEMFKYLRASEAKWIENLGYLDLETFKYYLKNNQMDESMYLEPSNTVNLSMDSNKLTTVTKNKNTRYILTKPIYNSNNFVCWLNTSDGKCYKAGDVIVLDNNIYLKAIYK